ncbi:MAG: hypothetical protein ACLFQE_06400 [Thermotogota bacterium]
MKRVFIGLTIGNDPHTLGIYKAAKIAKLAQIETHILPPSMSDEEKIQQLIRLKPQFIGLSYRLSPEEGLKALKAFLTQLKPSGFLHNHKVSICFAGLRQTIELLEQRGIDKQFGLTLIEPGNEIDKKTISTLDFFNVVSQRQRSDILHAIQQEAQPYKVELLDHLVQHVFKEQAYLHQPPLKKPSAKAMGSLSHRIKESELPIIRTHFGIPDETILPTVEGIINLAQMGVVDEISLGSSDLSQRYFDQPEMFKLLKNDGGVPYKDKKDLQTLYQATRRGNYPSIKPYAHVSNLKAFVDTCLDSGMLIGAHQAIPLFWFSELDGRGPLSVPDAIEEHIETVKYLSRFNIPVEMNDPNQWSSRFVHDTLFVCDYGLIASVLYHSGVKECFFQFQFNKPAETGDYADLAKMMAAITLIGQLRPERNTSKIIIETRSGIEHFSTDQEKAKKQLARTTLLQMLIHPDIIHLVSYCEADHAATVEDIAESSKIVREAVKVFKTNEKQILEEMDCSIIENRKRYLLEQAWYFIRHILQFSTRYRPGMQISEYHQCLSDKSLLTEIMKRKLMTAPGIVHPEYIHPGLFTKAGKHGFIDCYANWDDPSPISEQQRLHC